VQYGWGRFLYRNPGAFRLPIAVGRMRAGDALAAFQKKAGAANSIARNVLARFLKKSDAANSMRADEIKGVACVIVEGNSPVSPNLPYRLLLSPVEPFIR